MTESPCESPTAVDNPEIPSVDYESLPPLKQDRAFWGMTGTLFFGAFNDNVFKQLVLLLAATNATAEGSDQQGPAMILFAAPFILFSGIAGFFSERNSKRLIIILSKAAEVVVMSLGLVLLIAFPMAGVALSDGAGLAGLFAVLFLMGAQSAFFGPGKFGMLPEMLRERDLPKANGIVMMASFLAIIFGTAMAGPCKDLFVDPGYPWVVGVFCVLIAAIGLTSSIFLRRTPVANPDLRFEWSAVGIPTDVWRYLRTDGALLGALAVTCMFWLIGGVVLMVVNNLGLGGVFYERDNKFADTWTSLLNAAVGVGIGLGCVSAGVISRGRADFRLMRIGCAGTVLWLTLLSIPGTESPTLLNYPMTLFVLMLLGFFTGLFIVPLQVFLQSRPPQGQKGRIIATMNLTNWIFILFSGVLYTALAPLFERLAWINGMFLVTAGLMMLVVIFYRPRDEREVKEEPEC